MQLINLVYKTFMLLNVQRCKKYFPRYKIFLQAFLSQFTKIHRSVFSFGVSISCKCFLCLFFFKIHNIL